LTSQNSRIPSRIAALVGEDLLLAAHLFVQQEAFLLPPMGLGMCLTPSEAKSGMRDGGPRGVLGVAVLCRRWGFLPSLGIPPVVGRFMVVVAAPRPLSSESLLGRGVVVPERFLARRPHSWVVAAIVETWGRGSCMVVVPAASIWCSCPFCPAEP